MRMITFSNRFTPSTPLFQSLNILPVFAVNFFQICIFVYQCLNKLLPIRFASLFELNSEIHHYNTWSANNLHSTLFRLTFSQFSIRFRGPHFWNKLPTTIRDSSSANVFKKHLSQYLLAQLSNPDSKNIFS